MDRQKIIDACRDIIAATQQILDAVTQEQETELAMGKPTETNLTDTRKGE